MKLKLKSILHLSIVLNVLALPVLAATGNATSAKDLIGNPFTTFNSLPDSTRNGFLLVSGLVFLGALFCVAFGILCSLGKGSLGSTSQDAKMKSESVGALIYIAGLVLLAMMALGFVFWYFNTGNL